MGRPRGSLNRVNRQGERNVSTTIGLKPKARELLLVAAADQFRSPSSQAAKYIVDGLVRDGYIKPSATQDAI